VGRLNSSGAGGCLEQWRREFCAVDVEYGDEDDLGEERVSKDTRQVCSVYCVRTGGPQP
jgi:hypothetical protein